MNDRRRKAGNVPPLLWPRSSALLRLIGERLALLEASPRASQAESEALASEVMGLAYSAVAPFLGVSTASDSEKLIATLRLLVGGGAFRNELGPMLAELTSPRIGQGGPAKLAKVVNQRRAVEAADELIRQCGKKSVVVDLLAERAPDVDFRKVDEVWRNSLRRQPPEHQPSPPQASFRLRYGPLRPHRDPSRRALRVLCVAYGRAQMIEPRKGGKK